MRGIGFRSSVAAHVFEEQPHEPVAILAKPVVARGSDGHVRQDVLVDRAFDRRPRGRAALRDDGLTARAGARQPIGGRFFSTALVGSSRIKSGASLRNARARATRCRSPPESFKPRSPTGVSYPSGKRTMKSCAPAAAAARSISAVVAPGRP